MCAPFTHPKSITHLIIPNQIKEEGNWELEDNTDASVAEFVTVNHLMIASTIHSHPTQALFLSQIDICALYRESQYVRDMLSIIYSPYPHKLPSNHHYRNQPIKYKKYSHLLNQAKYHKQMNHQQKLFQNFAFYHIPDKGRQMLQEMSSKCKNGNIYNYRKRFSSRRRKIMYKTSNKFIIITDKNYKITIHDIRNQQKK